MARLNTIMSLALTVAATLVSCDRKTVYDRFQHTTSSGWEKSDTLVFAPIAIAATGVYAERLGLRTTGDYPFQRLSLIVEQIVRPSGRTIADTLNAQLVAENGEHLGKGISLYQYRLPLRSLTLQAGDTLSVRIRHDMKREILPGIIDVGVWVKKE